MSDHSEIGSRSPIPTVVESQAITFEAEQYRSSIMSTDQISKIIRRHGLKISLTIVVQAPHPDERSCYAPGGSDRLQMSAWSQEHLRAGVFLSLKPYFKIFTNFVKIAPFQLQSNSYRMLAGLKSMYHMQCLEEPSPQEIFYLLNLKKTPPLAHGGDDF